MEGRGTQLTRIRGPVSAGLNWLMSTSIIHQNIAWVLPSDQWYAEAVITEFDFLCTQDNDPTSPVNLFASASAMTTLPPEFNPLMPDEMLCRQLGTSVSTIDNGDPSLPSGPHLEFDFDLKPRNQDGDGDGIFNFDRGADEYTDEPEFIRGDSNGDAGFDISDVIFTLAFLFTPGAPTPACLDAADANDDGAIDIADATYSLAALFIPGSPSPPAPHPGCGIDPTLDSLMCNDGPC